MFLAISLIDIPRLDRIIPNLVVDSITDYYQFDACDYIISVLHFLSTEVYQSIYFTLHLISLSIITCIR